MNMHPKYDYMHENGMNCALKCTNDRLISSISFMLSNRLTLSESFLPARVREILFSELVLEGIGLGS